MNLLAHPTAAIDPHILDEAADWLMQLHDSTATDADRAACARWRQRSPDHARAWARAEVLLQKFEGLPSALAMPALDRPAGAGARGVGRRAAVGRLAALLAVAPVGWAAWQLVGYAGWSADYHTATGERSDIQLNDGTQISLSTATQVDVKFDSTQRTVHLRQGTILVTTAADAQHRPFFVQTAQGRLQALGTVFSVRQDEGSTHLAVLESAVRVSPADGGALSVQTLQAGQQTWFTHHSVGPSTPADDTTVAWTHGMLLADKMRLADFCAELSRWHPGVLRCDAAVADLRISGAFPVAQPEQALTMLVSTYPVDAATRLRGYWVTLMPR